MDNQWEERARIAEAALDQINDVMCTSFMVKDREFGRIQGTQIMNILEAHCEAEERLDAKKGTAPKD